MLENPIPWPAGKRCAVSITWDVDADSGLNYYNQDKADNLVASQSQTRYDPLIAVPRLVKLLRRLDMKQTFFIPGWCIEKYPAAVDMLLKDGHEIALHGYLHERPNEVSAEDELYWLQRALDAFERRVGNRPAGWRAPKPYLRITPQPNKQQAGSDTSAKSASYRTAASSRPARARNSGVQSARFWSSSK